MKQFRNPAIAIVFVAALVSILGFQQPSFAGEPEYEKQMVRGLAQLKKKDYEGAVAAFTLVLRDNPNIYEAYLNRAIARVEIKDFEGALSDYDQAIKINPNVTESYIKRGDLNSKQGNVQAAIDDYTQALRLDPKDPNGHLKRATTYKQDGEYAKAVEDYSNVLKLQPDSIPARQDRAECRMKSYDYDGAIDDYNYLLKKYKQKVFAVHYDLGEVMKLKGDSAGAGDHFNQVIEFYTSKLSKSKKQGWDYIRRGLAYSQINQQDNAISDLENGVALLPSDATARYHLGHARLTKGDTKGAIKELDEALKQNPRLNAALFERAEANVSLGEYSTALKDLDVALAVEKNPDGLVSRALARLALGDAGGGIADLQEAKKLNPKTIERRQKLVSDTVAAKESKGEKDLSFSQVLEQLALFDLCDNNPDTAEALTRRALEIQEKCLSKEDPKIAYSLLLLGKAYLQKNSVLKAEALFRSALTRLRTNPGGSQKYAVFCLEDCARILIQSSNTEDAGSILMDTRMIRAVTGLHELAFTGDLLRRAEQAIEAYKQKKKFDRQEDLVRLAAGMKHESSSSGSEEEVVESKIKIDKPIRDKWALIVGISHFKDPHHDLKFPSKDAKDFADFLIKEKGFANDHVKLLTDATATRANILSLLGSRWLPRVAEPDDLVVIYFSSHGSPSSLDVGGVNYLVAHDTDVNDLYTSGIAMQDLARIIKDRVHCERIVLVLDACHSGVAAPTAAKGLSREGNVNVETIVQGTGQLVLSSSSPEQRSWESKRYDGSVFTKHLMDGLRRNGKLTRLGDAFSYLNEETQREVLRDRGVMQSPIMKSKWEGKDLVIGATPTSPSPGLTDVELPDAGQKPATDSAAKGAKDKPKGKHK